MKIAIRLLESNLVLLVQERYAILIEVPMSAVTFISSSLSSKKKAKSFLSQKETVAVRLMHN